MTAERGFESDVTACWKEIGIWARGGATCEKLETLIHCHNCPVYASTGRRMLDRGIPADLLAERTRHYAAGGESASSPGASMTLFRIGAEWLAVPTRSVREVTEEGPVHRIPHRSGDLLLGLATIRGELHLVMSLAALLGLDTTAPLKPGEAGAARAVPRHILLQVEEDCFAFPVHEAAGVLRPTEAPHQPLPATLSRADDRFVTGLFNHDGHRFAVLDAGLLVYAFRQALG
jgi:chemotaxis-related protein WspD